MAIVYFLPGFAGSELFQVAEKPPLVWLDYAQIALGSIRKLRLSADGTTPAPPYGVGLVPGLPLFEYFGAAVTALRAQLAPHGIALRPIGFDWRKSADANAAALASRILADGGAAAPATIVGYSAGCLVARRAYWYLAQQGAAAACRRVVLIGGPNYGSYSMPLLWAGSSDTLSQLLLLSNLLPGIFLLPGYIGSPNSLSPSECISIVQTWPAAYELLPALGAPDAASDPQRAALYSGTWPADRTPSPAWIEYVTSVWQPWLISAAAVPPPAVLTCVGGQGVITPFGVRDAAAIGRPAGYGSTEAGDGRVTLGESLLPGSEQVTLNSSHADMYEALIYSGQLLALILDPREPPAPAPAPVVVPGVVSASRQEAPLPPRLFDGQFPGAPPTWHLGADP